MGGAARCRAGRTVRPPFRLKQPAFTLVSLMARYAVNDQISVQANIENLTDETYSSQIGFYDPYRHGACRNDSVTLKYAFWDKLRRASRRR